MNHLGLFEGIGGFSLAARWMGWDTVAWSEINPFCRKVLSYHFPKAEPLGDIKNEDFTRYKGAIDIISGGFPCQPYSVAGKRKGKDDDRHLWPEKLRAIREVAPRWVVGENVRGLLSWDGGLVFDEVCADLEAAGYEVQPFLLPACAVDAPHKRERIWFVAYAGSMQPERGRGSGKMAGETGSGEGEENKREWLRDASGCVGKGEHATNTHSEGLQRCGINGVNRRQGAESLNQQPFRCVRGTWENFPTQPPVCSGDDGLPARLDAAAVFNGRKPGKGKPFPRWRAESIKAYGNAIVPQVALQIFKAIAEYENQQITKDN